jgi:hypothetical protein
VVGLEGGIRRRSECQAGFLEIVLLAVDPELYKRRPAGVMKKPDCPLPWWPWHGAELIMTNGAGRGAHDDDGSEGVGSWLQVVCF